MKNNEKEMDTVKETYSFGILPLLNSTMDPHIVSIVNSNVPVNINKEFRGWEHRWFINMIHTIDVYRIHCPLNLKCLLEFVRKSIDSTSQIKEDDIIGNELNFSIYSCAIVNYLTSNVTPGEEFGKLFYREMILLSRHSIYYDKESGIPNSHRHPYNQPKLIESDKIFFKPPEVFKKFNILNLFDRLKFIREKSPIYYGIIKGKLPEITEKIFNIKAQNISLYRELYNLDPENVWKPAILEHLDLTDSWESKMCWFFARFPMIGSYLLGFPITCGVPGQKDTVLKLQRFLSTGKDVYYKNLSNTYTKPMIKLKLFDISCGNFLQDGEFTDVTMNDKISEFSFDDLIFFFDNGKCYIFTPTEYKSLLDNNQNPYNRNPIDAIRGLIEYRNTIFDYMEKKFKDETGMELKIRGPLKDVAEEFFELMERGEFRDLPSPNESQNGFRDIFDGLMRAFQDRNGFNLDLGNLGNLTARYGELTDDQIRDFFQLFSPFPPTGGI